MGVPKDLPGQVAETVSVRASDRDKVWAAADQIAARGDSPTVASVRTVAGVGQAATLKYLRSWREDQARQRIEAATLPDLPDDVATANVQWVEKLWRAALTQARSEADAAAAKAQADIAAVRAEADEIAASHDELAQEMTHELERRDDLIEESRRQIKALEERLAEADAQKVELKNQLDASTTALTVANEECSSLRGQLAGVREAMAALGAARGES